MCVRACVHACVCECVCVRVCVHAEISLGMFVCVWVTLRRHVLQVSALSLSMRDTFPMMSTRMTMCVCVFVCVTLYVGMFCYIQRMGFVMDYDDDSMFVPFTKSTPGCCVRKYMCDIGCMCVRVRVCACVYVRTSICVLFLICCSTSMYVDGWVHRLSI